MEIDEINPQQLDEEENNLTDLIYLDSKIITKDPERPERYHCPIWTQGLERTFKVRKNLKKNQYRLTMFVSIFSRLLIHVVVHKCTSSNLLNGK